MKTNISHYFEFKDWRACFALFEHLAMNNTPNLRLVVSTHWATEGYWIEDHTESVPPMDFVYTPDEYVELKERVEAEQNNPAPGLIL